MIPKIIHYCWFGGKDLPELGVKCLASWRKYFPDYEIRCWNEINSPMHLPYVQTALKNKNWANLSNLTRLYALKEFGGIYFDTDIEVIKPFDMLDSMQTHCMLGLETKPVQKRFVVNNAVMISSLGDSFTKSCYDRILSDFDGTEKANLSSPLLVTGMLKEMGFKGRPGRYRNVTVVSHDYFYPSAWNEIFDSSLLTKNTYCIHYNNSTWVNAMSLTDDDYLQLLRDIQFYKNSYKVLRSGNGTFLELAKINLFFFKNMFSNFFGRN